jgi:hypothetical protein
MAVTASTLATKLQIRIKTGVDENGNDVIANSIFNKVKTASTDDSIFTAAQTIGSLMSTPVVSVQKVNTIELVSVA